MPVAATTDSPFHLAAQGGNDIRLHTLVDGRLVVSVGPQLMLVQPDGSFAPDHAMLVGLVHPRAPGPDNMYGLSRWYAMSAGGRWPDDLVLATSIESSFRGESATPVVYRRAGGKWQVMGSHSTHYDWTPGELQPWIDGSLLTRRIYQPYYRGQETWEGEDEGPTAAQVRAAGDAIAGAPVLAVIRGLPKAPKLGARRVAAFAAWTSGDILLVSTEARPDVVLAGPDGERAHAALGIAEGWQVQIYGITAESASDAYIFGWVSPDGDGHSRPYLAHWNGTAASEVDVPPCEDGIASLVHLADDTLWTTCGSDLREGFNYVGTAAVWRKPAGGSWTQQAVPEAWGKPLQLAKLGQEVWLATEVAVARTGVPKAVLPLPSLEQTGNRVFEYGDPVPATTPMCSNALLALPTPVADAAVVQATLDRVIPAVVADTMVSLVKVKIGDETLLGVHVFSFNAAQIGRIEKAVRAAVGRGVAPARCFWIEADDDNTLASWSAP